MVLLLQISKIVSMKKDVLNKYASLLLNYCLEMKSGEKLLVNTTTLAEPLVSQLFDQCMQMGVTMDVIFDWEGKNESFAKSGHKNQAGFVSPLYREAMERFEGYLVIRAPFQSKGGFTPDPVLSEVRSAAIKAVSYTPLTLPKSDLV